MGKRLKDMIMKDLIKVFLFSLLLFSCSDASKRLTGNDETDIMGIKWQNQEEGHDITISFNDGGVGWRTSTTHHEMIFYHIDSKAKPKTITIKYKESHIKTKWPYRLKYEDGHRCLYLNDVKYVGK